MNTDAEISKKYEHILAQAAQLDRQTQIELLVELAAQLRHPSKPPGCTKHRLGELEGFFKGAWEGQDAQDYVNQERNSWVG